LSALAVGGWICLLAPLAGALVITLAGTSISRRTAAYLGTLSVFVAFAGALVSFFCMWGRDAADRSELSTAFTWLSGGSFHASMSILVDPLSIVMMLVVSGVGGLIVGYSIGYMDGDDEERRYFAYMAIFVFAMLMLVEAGNLLLLLAGWGLVGLASYLLIGFWHHRPEAVAAAKKAFVMNAIGDATMALGFFLLIFKTGSLDFTVAFGSAGGLDSTTVNLVALGLLGGAVAKSAQLPLQTWRPAAREGPTPVSALIHAATMVTAGVYLIVRTHAIFEAAPHVEDLAAGLGAATLVIAGLNALVQTDLKRVIAYSTMSQIGYMFLGAGLGAYANGMFHLVTHAFFKALLFLAAGLIIHHLAGEQDIRRMGGLRRYMPRTWLMFMVGSLALVGVPPFAGFWSKDAILASALSRGGYYGWILLVVGLFGAFLTGLYTFRLFFGVFYGEPSDLVLEHAAGHGDHAHGPEESTAHDAHRHGEGPLSMVLPVAVLTVLSVVGGLLEIAGVWHPFGQWIAQVAHPLVEPSTAQDWGTSAVTVAVGLAGVWIAWAIYRTGRLSVPALPGLQRVLEHKFYFDELYDAIAYRPVQVLAARLRSEVETPFVEGSLEEIGRAGREAGVGVARAQSGLLRSYAVAIAVSALVLSVVFIAVR
jgi:NADH-quinone oxidoreductase subunit L